MSHSIRSIFGLGLFALVCLINSSSTYSIHQSCQGADRTNVKKAADEALQVLRSAQLRGIWNSKNNIPAPYAGTAVKDLMGDDQLKYTINAIGT